MTGGSDSVISERKSVSSLNENERTALKAFLSGKDVFTLFQLASLEFVSPTFIADNTLLLMIRIVQLSL